MRINSDISKERLASLLEENMGLVVSVVDRVFVSFDKSARDDLIQCGRIGLWKAIVAHDPEKGKLSTIATNYIRWEIIRYIEKENTWIKNRSPQCVNTLIEEAKADEISTPTSFLLPDTLSDDEKKIIELKQAGFKNQEIADRISVNKYVLKRMVLNLREKIRDANKA